MTQHQPFRGTWTSFGQEVYFLTTKAFDNDKDTIVGMNVEVGKEL